MTRFTRWAFAFALFATGLAGGLLISDASARQEAKGGETGRYQVEAWSWSTPAANTGGTTYEPRGHQGAYVLDTQTGALSLTTDGGDLKVIRK